MLVLLLLPLLLLCSDYTAPVWVLAGPVTTPRASGSDQKSPLYMIFFKEDASQDDKKNYAKELEEAVTTESMGSISVGKDDFILGALLTDAQLSEWNKNPVSQFLLLSGYFGQRAGTHESQFDPSRSRKLNRPTRRWTKKKPKPNPTWKPEIYTTINFPLTKTRHLATDGRKWYFCPSLLLPTQNPNHLIP